jgi:hypothetical protein
VVQYYGWLLAVGKTEWRRITGACDTRGRAWDAVQVYAARFRPSGAVVVARADKTPKLSDFAPGLCRAVARGRVITPPKRERLGVLATAG